MAGDEVRRALPRWLTVVLGVAGTVVALAGLHAGSAVVGPALLALVLAVVVHPVLAGLRRRGAPRWVAVSAAVLVADGGLVALVLAVGYALARLAAVLPQYAAQWTAAVGHLRSGLTAVGLGPEEVDTVVRPLESGTATSALTGLLGGVVGALTTLIVVLMTVLFLCADAATLPDRLAGAAEPASRLGPTLVSFTARTRTWFGVTTVFGLVVAVLDGVALVVLGVPLPFLWAVLSFVTNYIPNVGFLLGLLPPALLALVVDGPRSAILVVVVYSVINFVLQSLIQPVFVSDAVDLSLTATFLSLVLWAAVLGPLGAVLSTPMSLLVSAVVLEADPRAAWARALISHGSVRRVAPHEGSASPGPGGRRRRPLSAAHRPPATE